MLRIFAFLARRPRIRAGGAPGGGTTYDMLTRDGDTMLTLDGETMQTLGS